MNQQWQTAVDAAVREVFESLCFMVPTATRASLTPPAGTSRVVVVVDFCGAGQGSLQLTLPDSMIASVASSMLGEDGPLPLAEQYEAICELANIVCGNALPRVAGERAVFDLASPRVIATMATDVWGVAAGEACVLLDEGLVCASLELRLDRAHGDR